MINFQDYRYYPCIRTRQAELAGIKELTETTKNKILPVVSLAKNRNGDASRCMEQWLEAFEGPSIIDMAKSHAIAIEGAKDYLSSDNNFKNWVNFADSIQKQGKQIIPVAQLTDEATKREFAQQVLALQSVFEKMAIRVNPLQRKGMQAATLAASLINDPTQALIIFDVGQISPERQKFALDACIRGINQLRELERRTEIVLTGSSFPRSFPEYGRESGSIPMLEWENFHALGGEEVALYGDYASIHGEFYPGSYAKFVARVDYPTPGNWIYERRTGDDREALYIQAAQEIIRNEEWDDELQVWGAETIKRVANGDAHKMKTPAKWIAVRVNLHIERILQFLEAGTVSTPNRMEEDSWDDSDDIWD